MNTSKRNIAILLVLFFVASCSKDFLDKKPHEFTDAVFWKTAAQAESALAGVYTPLQDEEALGGEEWSSIETFSDNAYMNDNYSDYIAMSEFRASQNNEGDLSHNSYVSYYKTIKRATDVLTNVPAIKMDANNQKRILGEANFLLAFSYFELAARYGGLPIYNSNDAAAALVRKTEAETWTVIENSLKAATSQLAWEHEEGRPGLGAAWGMLAKVYAYEKKWAEAKAAAETVIASGKHALSANYAQVFSIAHENDTEILFGLGARMNEYPITPEKFHSMKDDLGNGVCTPKKIVKLAKLADHDGVIHTSWGDLNYTAGNDFIVKHGPNDYGAVKKDIFAQTYDTPQDFQ